MKKSLCLAASLLALNLTPVFGQPGGTITITSANLQGQPPALTKFNLDFPGGTPKELVAAIEKAIGKPLNVIIPPDEKTAKVKLPPIKVSQMDVSKLFDALEQRKSERGEVMSNVGFFTQDKDPTDNSLWKFSIYENPSILTKFDLDFPGGTPAQLVKAIEKATGKPLNVIISEADADTKLPPLKMDNVDTERLFQALEQASSHQVLVNTGGYNRDGSPLYSQAFASYAFKTEGRPTDNSVWFFRVTQPVAPLAAQKICRYYSLAPYLDRGFTVDDITTAIQTGWKLAGETATPTLNYHKETKLLMAYGEADKLKTIDDVLKTLPQTRYDLPTVADKVKKLQEQVDELKRNDAPTPALGGGVPAEKSAK